MKQLFTLLLLATITITSYSQDQQKFLNVFLDCDFCDEDYFMQNLTYVNYVRDRKLAEVHVIFSRQRTASRGREIRMEYLGQKQFQGQKDTVVFIIEMNTPDLQENEQSVEEFSYGLLPYLIQTPFRKYIKADYTGPDPEDIIQPEDKWKNWIFTLNGSGLFSEQALFKSSELNGSIYIRRVTEDVRLQTFNRYSREKNTYQLSEDEEVVSFFKDFFSSTRYIKAINEHWSYGAETNFRSSVFRNIQFQNVNRIALEYNIFPYSESSRRQFRINSEFGYDYRIYNDTTIYDKLQEGFFVFTLNAGVEVQEKWGEIDVWIEGASYLDDPLKRYYASLFTGFSLQVTKGLNLNLYGNIEYIRNQIELPKGGASTEDILLQQRQLATNYNYWVSTGFSYTFGSIYNNVVNPRFGF